MSAVGDCAPCGKWPTQTLPRQLRDKGEDKKSSPLGTVSEIHPDDWVHGGPKSTGDGSLVEAKRQVVQRLLTQVKTLVIGEVVCPKGEPSTVRSQAHSYFSRLLDVTTFADLASVEVGRLGAERAKEVWAVQDGAEWLQSCVDSHRHDVVHILNFAHAGGYLSQIAEQA